MGTSTIALTLEVFAHVLRGMQARASLKLETLLRNSER
jgi:hypothetical protein